MVILVLTKDKETLKEEHLVATHLQEFHGIIGQVVLVMDMNQEVVL